MDAATIILTRLARGSTAQLESHLLSKLEAASRSVYFCNVHMLMLAQRDAELAAAMEATDLLIPDGVPLAWLQRLLGVRSADVFRGYQAMHAVCEQAVRLGRPVGLFGSTEAVLEPLDRRLKQDHKGLEIAFRRAPTFGDIEMLKLDDRQLSEINHLGLHCLFVSLGCPKQEKWIALHRDHLECAMLGVGAAFPWLAGTTPMPPLWMERSGIGWLHRLLEDPAHMWRRYLVSNTQFLVFAAKVLANRTKLSNRDR